MTNPYLPQQAQAITQQANNNLFNYQMPQINSGAIAAGGFGGSRQGIAQGLAIGQTNQGLSSSLASLYGNAYESDQNRGLQERTAQMQNQTTRDLGFGNLDLGRTQAANNYSLGQGNLALGNKQADNSYNLGMGNLGLSSQVADQNFYTAQRGQDLSQYSLGANLANTANLGLSSQGQQLYQNGQQQQQAPFNVLQQYGQLLSPFTGLNNSRSETTPGASTIGSAMGGALTAAQLWALLSKGFGG